MFDKLRQDAARYRGWGGWWRAIGFWVVATYRFGSWARDLGIPGVSVVLGALAWTIKQPFRITLHVELPFRARIGPGFALFHPYNVLIGAGAVIGEQCSLYHEVTLGAGPTHGEPTLGDHVVVFAGARVIGGVSVGDRSEIGCNCVVTKDVPAHSLVVPTLSRVVPLSMVSRPTPAPEGPSVERPVAPVTGEGR